jgi:hypothetical protein
MESMEPSDTFKRCLLFESDIRFYRTWIWFQTQSELDGWQTRVLTLKQKKNTIMLISKITEIVEMKTAKA